MNRRWTAALGGLLLLLPLAGQGQQQGTVFVATQVRASPSPTARVLGSLPADTTVTVDETRGLWFRVTPADGGAGGWVRRFDVRTAAGAQRRGSGGNVLGNLGNLFSRNGQDSDQVTATIGVRGLDAADLQGARPDPGAVRALDAYRASPAEAEGMARGAGLVARQVAYPEETAERRDPGPERDEGGFGFGDF